MNNLLPFLQLVGLNPILPPPEEVHRRRQPRDYRVGVGDHAGGERRGGDQEVVSSDEDSCVVELVEGEELAEVEENVV